MIYLGLGSNMGDRESNLRQAVGLLDAHPEIHIIKKSAIYETEPFGYTDQATFFNAVVAIESNLSPIELLNACLETESQLGRLRNIRWGPRIIDIDILLFHNQLIDTAALIVPHPYMHTRPFVLVPLRDLTGDDIVLHGLTAAELLARCEPSAVTFYHTFD